jgi:hypothetical protein
MPVIIDGTNGVSTPNTFAFKNRLINAQLLINQRGVSGTVSLAAGAYGHDRFKAGASGCTYTFATTNNVTTLTISAGSLQQVIEGLNLESGTYTLSWTGTAQGKIGAGSYGASGITGSITGGTNTTIEFNTGTLSLPQLEVGSTATSFDYRPYGTELALCQRYYYKTYNTNVAVGTSTVEGVMSLEVLADGTLTRLKPFSARLPVSMRAQPTVTAYSETGTADRISVYNNSASTLTVSSIAGRGENSFGSYLNTTTNASAAASYVCQFVASAEL